MQDAKHNSIFFSLIKFFATLSTRRAVLIITIMGFFVFGNALFNNFIEDDKKYIIDYPPVHQVNLATTFGVNVFNAAGQYRPIPATYFSILYSLFTTTPFFYHFLQIGLHIVVTLLLYFIFCKFLSKGIAFLGALVFLAHPIQVESVSYIAQAVSPLFSLFGLIPLLLLTKEKLSRKNYAIGFSLLLLSLFTKEAGIVFLFLILFYCFLFVRKNLFKLVGGMFIVLSVYAFFRFVVGHVWFSTRLLAPIASASLPERLINMPLIIFYYLKTFFFPSALAFDQQWIIHTITFSHFYLPLMLDTACFLILVLCGFYLFRKHQELFKPYLFFAVWFGAGLFFHVQIFPLDATVGDRWFYLPMMGLLGVLSVIFQAVIIHARYKNIVVFVSIAIVIISCLSVRTIIRNENWHDAITLYTHDIVISDNYDIENSLGTEYQAINNYTTALIHFERSKELRPNEFNLHNIGVSYEDMGDMQKARMYFVLALHAKDYKTFLPHKHDENTYKSYASILLYYDDKANESFIKHALLDYPGSSDLWMFLALSRLLQHEKQAALVAATEAYQLSPNQEDTYIYQHIVSDQPFFINLYGKSINFE